VTGRAKPRANGNGAKPPAPAKPSDPAPPAAAAPEEVDFNEKVGVFVLLADGQPVVHVQGLIADAAPTLLRRAALMVERQLGLPDR
jgi:hypothetical protein